MTIPAGKLNRVRQEMFEFTAPSAKVTDSTPLASGAPVRKDTNDVISYV